MKNSRRVYLDNAATTPLHPQVLEAMMPYLKDVSCSPLRICYNVLDGRHVASEWLGG